MNNKGFTLVEVLLVLVLVSLVLVGTISLFSSTMAINKDEAYKVMKNNIVSSSYDYLNECDANIIECHNTDSFYASVLTKYGYFGDLTSPIDGKYLGNCLLVKSSMNYGVRNVVIEDLCY